MSDAQQGTPTATGVRIGHGPIRLRRPASDAAPVGAAPITPRAGVHGPVGHGVIRLLAAPAPAAPAPAPAPAVAAPPAPAPAAFAPPAPAPAPVASYGVAMPDAVGHGSIRLVDRALSLPPDATDAAEADILATLSAAG